MEKDILKTFAAVKIVGLNIKNKGGKEYSSRDVSLLNKWERRLSARGFKREDIEGLSPAYYGE